MPDTVCAMTLGWISARVGSVWAGKHQGCAEDGRHDRDGTGGGQVMNAGYALPFRTMLLTCRPGSSVWVWKEHCNAHHLVLAAAGYPHP